MLALEKTALHHSESAQHSNAVGLVTYHLTFEKDGGVQSSLHRIAVKMQCLYWLVKAEIPHITNYSSLVDAVQFMGCDYFKHLHRGDNAKYKSQCIISEILQVLAAEIEKKQQLEKLASSSFYSLMIDETTDIWRATFSNSSDYM